MSKKQGQSADPLRRELRRRARALKRQHKDAAARAKYGPSGKPAPVTVRKVGEAERTVDQARLQRRRYGELVEDAARRAGWASYEAYLHSAHWRKLRRRVLERDGWRCCLCRSKSELRVHHDRYNVDLRSQEIGHLKTMCDECHRHVHGRG